ncbi:MAG: patatin-like phospholipase family protein [Thermoanaerobaculia bacterium]
MSQIRLSAALVVLLQLTGPGPAAAEPAGPVAARPVAARPKIGLALSGGGAKGLAHIGVLRVLEEQNVPVDYVAGTSMGAIVGGLYALGMNADEIEATVRSIDWNDIMEDKPARRDLSFRRKSDDLRYLADLELGLKKGKIRFPGGLRTGQKLMFTLQSLTLPAAGVSDFDDLPIPFRCVATDIATGDMVVLGEGDLAYAIRASMAIPGVFSPVELGGKLLVDGAAANNIPVDVVKAMGADVVIAVDISAQLATREELDSFLGILGQARAMQNRKNMEPRLAMADLVITPEVTMFKVLGFADADEIIARGDEKARAHAGDLEAYAVDAETYARYVAARPRLAPLPEKVDSIRFEGNQRVDDRIISGRLSVRPGGALDLEALSADLGKVYGLGDFELIDFALEQEDGETALVIRGREKPWGPTYIKTGLFLESDLDGASSFAILVNLTATRLNARGGEWRNDLQVGRERRLFSELYQPLDFNGGWFVAPSLEYERNRLDFFLDGRNVAEIDAKIATLALDLGYQFGSSAEIRLGIERGNATADVATGSLPQDVLESLEIDDVDFGAVVFEGTYDRLDSAGIPRHGGFARLRAFLSFEDLGADDEYDKLEAVAAQFVTRGRHTFLGNLNVGWSPGGELPVYDEFTLGGFRSLSGFQEDELRGQYLGVGRLGYYYRLTGKIYAGGWIEAGNVWQTSDEVGEDLFVAVTLLLGTETLAGPLYLAYGIAEEGNSRLYLSLGRSF